jgi:hypothetical protein
MAAFLNEHAGETAARPAARQPAARRAVRHLRGLRPRRPLHRPRGGFPDALFPAVYNANLRILQSAGVVTITYELIHDTRIIPIAPAMRQNRCPTAFACTWATRAVIGGNDAGG